MDFIFKEFFGKNGLTSTSANHIANIAKEFYNKLETEVNNISAFTVTAKVIGSEDTLVTHIGTTNEEFSEVDVKLRKIAECKGLIAYLREAIKERERLFDSICTYTDEAARDKLVKPRLEREITADVVKSSWPISELIRYYRLEAKCAVLGKYIHEEGVLNKLRKNFYKTLQNPINVVGSGRDTIAETLTPTIFQEELENKFFALQEEYRNTQAELNGMKHSIDEAIEKDKIEKENKYSKEYDAYAVELEKISNAEVEKRNVALAELQKLKIVIPTRFKSIYDEIAKLG